MIRRSLAFVLLMSFFAVPAFSQDEEVSLRWRTRPDNQTEIDVYQRASEEIDAAWEGVALQYEPGGSENAAYQDVLVTEIEAGTAPDVFWIPGTDVARFAEAGLILNLADFAAADPGFDAEDFYPGPMGFLTTPVEEGGEALWGCRATFPPLLFTTTPTSSTRPAWTIRAGKTGPGSA
jgi:ABC-type glycerol-3-phosphate transport system substrate-binding protein